jgi:uncharacterized protein (DUF427 family)
MHFVETTIIGAKEIHSLNVHVICSGHHIAENNAHVVVNMTNHCVHFVIYKHDITNSETVKSLLIIGF